jgi:cellulose synthase operon protein C
VLGVFDSAGGLPPPPLSAQRDAPALVSQLLFRQLDSAVNEALAIVWETTLYRRDVASYGLTGVERVQPNATTQLGETFTSLLRLFGLGRIWLFHRRTPGPVRAEVVLLASPAVVLSGDVAQSDPATLLYTLGSNIIGGMPEHALVNGMPEDDLRTLIDALVAAFGPLDAAPRGNRAVVRLEQSLWQLIPPRAERRLREICAHPDQFTFESAVRCTRQAMRRAGLFASGSLSTAVREVAQESGYDLEPLRMATDGLERACLENPEIADLVRLAIRTEYAEARWLPPRPEEPESRRSRHSVP